MRILLWIASLIPIIPAACIILATFVYVPAFEPLIKKVAPSQAVDYASWTRQVSVSVAKITFTLNCSVLKKFLPSTLLIGTALALYMTGLMMFFRQLR